MKRCPQTKSRLSTRRVYPVVVFSLQERFGALCVVLRRFPKLYTTTKIELRYDKRTKATEDGQSISPCFSFSFSQLQIIGQQIIDFPRFPYRSLLLDSS